MGYPEKRQGSDGAYYRARYLMPDGRYGTVKDSAGRTIKFRAKRMAKTAADEAEQEAKAAAQRGKWVAPEAGRTLFRQFVLGPEGDEDGSWLAAQDIAVSTDQSYGHYLKHILPTFGETPIGDIDERMVDAWEKRERAAGAASSAKTYRKILALIFDDAVRAGLRHTNPARRPRNRGKRAGRSTTRGPEKKITTMIGALLLAERASLLSGRDDEFVACILTAYTGMRWGEVVGLEPQYAREQARAIRVEQQLYELETGPLALGPPKDDSYRTLDSPGWLSALLAGHVARTRPAPCHCHGRAFVFRGRGAGRSGSRSGPTLADVAKTAGVSTGTVSNVLNRPEQVREATRARVQKAIAELGFVRGGSSGEEAAHWRRSGFATWIFTPAATGWYPAKAPHPKRPVPILAEPWPGVPARGRGAAGRATTSWLPIQEGLTRHGLRHTHRTVMEEVGTPKVLMDERLGHMDGSVSANYAHVTESMRQQLMGDLTRLWNESLDARLAMCPTSPVSVLDRLLKGRAAAVGEG